MGSIIGLAPTHGSVASAAGCATSAIPAAEGDATARLVSDLNGLRRSRGLGTLVVNNEIANGSAYWSGRMAEMGSLRHARDTGPGDGIAAHEDYVYQVSQAVPDWSGVAENVGYRGLSGWCTSAELRSAAVSAAHALHVAFTQSSGHYRNMVGDYNQVGIGSQIENGRLWVTVRFAKGSLPVTYSSSAKADAAEYIHAVHRLFVNRSASSSEVSRWSGDVLAGRRLALTNALAASNEWAGERVNDLYETVLGRSADPDGRRMWVRAIANGRRLEAVAASFYGSDEYFRRNGNTNRSFVQALYRDILGRSADPTGLENWQRKIRRGTGRSTIAAGFYGSIESRADRVESLYKIILGRSVDPTGKRTWTRKLISTGDIVLAATLATSKEYYNRATR